MPVIVLRAMPGAACRREPSARIARMRQRGCLLAVVLASEAFATPWPLTHEWSLLSVRPQVPCERRAN